VPQSPHIDAAKRDSAGVALRQRLRFFAADWKLCLEKDVR
jgi:hypothetical protein